MGILGTGAKHHVVLGNNFIGNEELMLPPATLLGSAGVLPSSYRRWSLRTGDGSLSSAGFHLSMGALMHPDFAGFHLSMHPDFLKLLLKAALPALQRRVAPDLSQPTSQGWVMLLNSLRWASSVTHWHSGRKHVFSSMLGTSALHHKWPESIHSKDDEPHNYLNKQLHVSVEEWLNVNFSSLGLSCCSQYHEDRGERKQSLKQLCQSFHLRGLILPRAEHLQN